MRARKQVAAHYSPDLPHRRCKGYCAPAYIINADGTTAIVDGVLNTFDDSFSNNIDRLDTKKTVNPGENLSLRTGGQLLAIERRHISAPDTIFLDLSGGRFQQYQFRFNAENINTNSLEGFLEDTYLHTRLPLNLSGSTVVNFSVVNVAGSYANDRFRIVFASAKVLPVTFTSLKAYTQGKNINVEWMVETR